MKTERVVGIATLLAIFGLSIYSIRKNGKKTVEKAEERAKSEERLSVKIKEEQDDRPTSTQYVPKEDGEVRDSYDLDKFTNDTFQVGYELTSLILREYDDLLKEDEDYIRFDGSSVTEGKYVEMKFDGRYRANIMFFGKDTCDEMEGIFYKEFLKKKSEKLNASFNVNEHIILQKGTYKSFADLAWKPTESTEELTVGKITLGRVRLEDLVSFMILMKDHGYVTVLMY